MVVSIPVSRFSCQILTTLYGSAPIIVPTHDSLRILLSVDRMGMQLDPVRLSELLCREVSFQVDSRFGRSMQRRANSIGIALFRAHKREMCLYTHACVASGRQAMSSIQDWLDAHNVSEDDMALDNAYKIWQRFGWSQKKQKKNSQKAGHKTAKAGTESPKKRDISLRPSAAMLTPVTDPELAYETAKAMIGKKYRFPDRYYHQLRLYMYVSVGYSCRAAAKKTGHSKTAIGRAASATQKRLNRSAHIATIVVEALASAALPQPV